jgi:xylan 1,4-beta-xylosidase
MDRCEFRCDLSQQGQPLPHVWEHTVGSDHALVALRADWQEQLRRCQVELGFRYVRFHGLLSDDVGTLVRQDDELLYSFFNADRIFDFLLSIGMKPFVELSFMPTALASGEKTVFQYRGNVTPPHDHDEWATLIRRLAAHWVDRYGAGEVREWFFEVWNEPNQKEFWTGQRDDYFRLYRYAAEALKAVDPALRVGGPATSKNAWIDEFLDFCEEQSVPADFISTHHYPTDPFAGSGLDTETQLTQSRRSLLREQAQDARRRARGRALYYTEWNASSDPRDPLHDEPYAAAFVTKTVLEASGLVESYGFWTFTDIFEENYFPSVPFHGGFGLLTLHGIPKPTYRTFQLLRRLGTERLLVDGLHATVDAWVIRGEGKSVTVVLTNHALPRHPIERVRAAVHLTETARPRSVSMERIDETHANPKRLWRKMGAPEYLQPAQVERLEKASRLAPENHPWRYRHGVLTLQVDLPPHSVAALTVDLADGSRDRGGVARPGAAAARRGNGDP